MTTYQDYLQLALRTEKPLPTVLDRLGHAALGFITETGEIATTVKRLKMNNKQLDDMDKAGRFTLRQNLREEIGDVCWYLAIACDALTLPEFFAGVLPRMHAISPESMTVIDRLDTTTKALASVVGRFAGHVAGCQINDSDHTVQLLTGEVGLIGQQLVTLCDLIGANFEEVLDENIRKLQGDGGRYKAGFTAEEAEARADKGGLSAKES